MYKDKLPKGPDPKPKQPKTDGKPKPVHDKPSPDAEQEFKYDWELDFKLKENVDFILSKY